MEILSNKYIGIYCICEQCGALLGNIQENEIYEDNAVYCMVCHFRNILPYSKSYNGIIKNPNSLAENTKES